jgi:type III pantothenate kinase
MNIFAIDSGNTRVKWGLWQGDAAAGQWLRVGALGHDEIDDRDVGIGAVLSHLPPPERVALANVAGDDIATALSARLKSGAPVTWAESRSEQCGVRNGYAEPSSLGVDRWAALIGARHLHRGACLVVCAGTATTVDVLSPDSEFTGGVILPGLDLMKRSLAENTARLPLAEGVFSEEPRSTADAIETGVLQAQAGAIERMHARALARHGEVACLLSGGSAARIAPQLRIAHRLRDHLVLDGLVRMALEVP